MKKFVLLLTVLLVLSATTLAAWKDGTYVGYSDAGAKSYNVAIVTIRDGKIVDVWAREHTEKDVAKNWNTYPWPQAAEAVKAVPAAIVAAQSTAVDGVAGATGTSTGIRQAADRALAKAAGVDNGQYFDGTFMGSSAPGARGYYEVVWVTVKGDKVVDLKIERVNADGSIQNLADYAWDLGGAREKYTAALKGVSGPHVDAIAGVTGSVPMWNDAVAVALSRASAR